MKKRMPRILGFVVIHSNCDFQGEIAKVALSTDSEFAPLVWELMYTSGGKKVSVGSQWANKRNMVTNLTQQKDKTICPRNSAEKFFILPHCKEVEISSKWNNYSNYTLSYTDRLWDTYTHFNLFWIMWTYLILNLNKNVKNNNKQYIWNLNFQLKQSLQVPINPTIKYSPKYMFHKV